MPPSVFVAVGGKQAKRKKKKIDSHGVEQMAKFFAILLTFSRKTLAYLGKGRSVKDRTSHMDLEWFSSPSLCPQLSNCLCIQGS